MNETEFCYWLQGFFELSNSNMLSSKQVQQIKDHLDLVFTKVTPDRNTKNKFQFASRSLLTSPAQL